MHIFPRRYQKTGTAAGWITHGIFLSGLHDIDHHFNDMPWGSKLAVSAGSGYFREQVFIKIAFGISIIHLDFIDHLHDLI